MTANPLDTLGKVGLGLGIIGLIVLTSMWILTMTGVIKELAPLTTTAKGPIYRGSDASWPSHLGILVTDEGVCLDAKGVQWDGTPVTIYSSAKGTVDIQNTCRVFIAGGTLEVRDQKVK